MCAGGSVLLTATAGKAYKWSNGATSQAITVTQAGFYVVEVTDENGCVGKSVPVEVKVAEKLVAPKIAYTEPLIICKSGSVKLSVPAQEGTTYVWKKDNVPMSGESHEFTATEAGVYTVELSNFCGTAKSSNKVELKIQQPIPAFEVEAAGSLVFCKGGSVRLSVPVHKDVTYAWFLDGKPVSGSGPTISVKEAGSYTAEITNTCGTFRSGKGRQVELLALPEAPSAESAIGCSKTALTLKASGGKAGMYRWYAAPTGGVALVGADGSTFTTPALTTSTTYYVALTNGQCESERVPVEAVINTKPAAPAIVADGPLEFCEGGAVKLSTIPSRHVEYIWLRNEKEIARGVTTLQATEGGTYTLRLQNTCGTTASSNSISVKVRSAPAAPVVRPGSSCGPGKVVVTATGGGAGEYRWYENATTAKAIGGATGATFETPVLQSSRTYYVSLVRGECETGRVPVQAIIFPVPEASASVQHAEITSGESTQLTGSGGASYSWSPSIGLSNPSIASPLVKPLQTTRYTLTVTNAEGCEDTTSVVVNVRQLLEIPNAFSPNGDGVNDTWEIKNIQYYPASKVEIYNRWGNLIYEKTNYQSEWDGTYRGAILPVSTYFYVITVPGKDKFTGYLNIVN
ncbi:hypothetical protein OB13_18405 [Pontibacter sp. HJ8]